MTSMDNMVVQLREMYSKKEEELDTDCVGKNTDLDFSDTDLDFLSEIQERTREMLSEEREPNFKFLAHVPSEQFKDAALQVWTGLDENELSRKRFHWGNL